MKKKLFSFILAICLIIPCALILSACGKDEEEYNLEIHAVLVGQGKNNEEKIITDSERTAFETKVAENHEAFTANGVYTEQDRVDLKAPHLENYKFVGWYTDEGEWITHYMDFSTEATGWWNMYARDGYVEARYEPLCYDITYVFGLVGGGSLPTTPEHTNPTYHNCIKDGAYTLVAPTVEHYTFSHWEYYVDGTIYDNFTTLPTNEEELFRTNDFVNQNPIESITIFGLYTETPLDIYTVAVTKTGEVDAELKPLIVLMDNHSEGLENGEFYEGTVLTIRVDCCENEPRYTFDGFYINNSKVTEGYSHTSYTHDLTITITGNVTIEIRVNEAE